MMGVTEKPKRYKLRRETVFFLILMSFLCSCGGIGTKHGTPFPYPWEERKKQILAWAASEKTEVERGELKNSEYWIQFFQKTIELRPDLDDFLYFANEMIKVSRIFEEGKITKEQFEDKHRQLTDLLAQEENRRAKVLASRTSYLENYESELFYCYRSSLFLGYVKDLRGQLKEAGPQFSSSHCTLFGDSIKCTTQNPYFF
jgi:hypothetical protein